MTDRFIGTQSGKGPAHSFRKAGMPSREAFDMQFVDNCFVPWGARLAVVAPCEGRVDDGGQHRKWRVVARIEREILLRVAEAITMNLITPADVPPDRLRVGFEHDLVRVESMPAVGSVEAVNPIAIQLARKNARDVAVPDKV